MYVFPGQGLEGPCMDVGVPGAEVHEQLLTNIVFEAIAEQPLPSAYV